MLLNWFKDRKIRKIYKKIIKLDKENPSKKRSLATINSDIDEAYYKLSDMFFEALRKKQYKTIKKILKLEKIELDKIKDNNGYNVVVHSLYKGNSDIFIELYTKCFSATKSYFLNGAELYSIILNKNNTRLMEFFIKTKNLRNSLTKQLLTPTLLLLLKNNKLDLIDILLKDYINEFNSRDIKAYLIYFISYSSHNVLKDLLSYKNLIYKLNPQDIAELFTLAYTNNNYQAFELLTLNDFLINSLDEPYSTAIKAFVLGKNDYKKLNNLFISK